MSRKSLSDIGVSNLKPRAQRYAFPDPELRGHYVRVAPSGAKTFAVVARDPQGKQVWASIGPSDTLKVEEARERARRALQRIRGGLPPFEEAPTKPATFEEVAASWMKRHVEAKGLRSKAEMERCLKVYVLPDWRDRGFVSIRRGDITALLDKIEDDRGPRQADVVLGILRGIANWYAARHDDYASPFTKGMKRQPQTRRERILSDDELRAVWWQAERAGTFGAIVRMALLTGQRREKIATMRWADLSGDVWSIPASARGKGAGGSLKLPPAAVTVINSRPRMVGNPYVFAGRGNNAFNGFSKCKAAFDDALPKIKNAEGEEVAIANWTLHDLRRTARSLMSRVGVRPDIAERVLGHVIAGVEGIYDRHRYDEEKALALDRLASMIALILNPPGTNVVAMKERGQ
jgi:integrase